MPPKEDMFRLGLSNPRNLSSLTLKDWDHLIRLGRKAEMLGRIHALLDESGFLRQIPGAPRAHLEAAHIVALDHERVVRWEVYCIQRALAQVEPSIVLLKGAAYVMSKLPFARGRLQSDVDILVPRSNLDAVESALFEHGWQNVNLEKYYQRYYRRWSHELPPLYHPERGTVIDVHHNILPVKGRLHPDPAKLLERAQPIDGSTCKRLCAADMVLHAAAHMFQSGDFHQGLRELMDVDGLIRFFSARPAFWQELLERTPEMDMHRPLFYALRYCRLFLETPIPEFLMSASQAWQPPRPILRVMDQLVFRALPPRLATMETLGSKSARWLLNVRSHWLSMPPLLLTQHFIHKTFKRQFSS
jgi:hypothetical protein